MKDRHLYYPESGWYWKWVIGGLILFGGGSLLVYHIYEVFQ